MNLQIVQDSNGQNTGVFVPINDWNEIILKHQDLKTLVTFEQTNKMKLSELIGSLSNETAESMKNYVADSRNDWEYRLSN